MTQTGKNVGSVEVAGLRIGYRRGGTGLPLVLLHGGWSDSREWRLLMEELSDEFTTVAWDAPGCGRSSDPSGDLSLDDYADLVASFIRALDLDRPHLVGLSFGGGLAIDVVVRHPTLCRSLTLVSAYAGWAGSLPADVVEARLRTVLAEADGPPADAVEGSLTTLFASTVDRTLMEEMATIMRDARPAGITPMARAFAMADLRDSLDDVRIPTLVIAGERDERAPLAVARDLQERIRGARLVVLPGVGHMCNIEAPRAFGSIVREFLAGVQ